jgi:hypothetical protein
VEDYSEIQPFLRPGEELRWSGRPDPSVIFNSGDLWLVPFSIM